MPHSSKPIVAICGSSNIDYIDLDKYINPSHVGEIVSGESLGIDAIARDWAFKNKIEYIEYKPNFDIWGDAAIFERDKDMIQFADIAIIFWNGKCKSIAAIINYIINNHYKYIIHIIENTD